MRVDTQIFEILLRPVLPDAPDGGILDMMDRSHSQQLWEESNLYIIKATDSGMGLTESPRVAPVYHFWRSNYLASAI